jgi:hypothetical protein
MNSEHEELVAPCGLYCGACSIRLAGRRGDHELLKQIAEVVAVQQGQEIQAKDLACNGCLSSDVVAIVCRNCQIRACALKKGIRHCSECADLPCQQLTDFSKDGLPHHGEVLKNIDRRHKVGLASWAEEQRLRWRCPKCGAGVDWYASQCYECTADLPQQFSPPHVPGTDTASRA